MRIVFMGPPGVGKGTQSQKLVDYLQVPHVASGDMLRKAKQGGNTLGPNASGHAALDKEVARQMDLGRLVPDTIVVEMMGRRLSQPDCTAGFLLDGFPRTLPQAESLDQCLADHGTSLDVVLALDVNPDELFRRLMARAETQDRADDTEETIRRRMQVYRDQTEPLLDYYRGGGILRTIDGMGSPEEVFSRIQAVCRAEGREE
ncbi:MAG: adenylate kinase [Pirellulaceae bacterium]